MGCQECVGLLQASRPDLNHLHSCRNSGLQGRSYDSKELSGFISPGRRNDTSTERWDVSQQLRELGTDVTQMDSSEITQGAVKTQLNCLWKSVI